jgi:beta-galactosidase
MQPITFDSTTYRIDGQPIYLLSGEFHYFRVPKADWRRRMRLFKEAGGNVLATYVPWLIHEPEEGEFRFSGEDWLDLEGFLQTAQEDGLYVIARPGPYQYSELVYHGLPGWLVKNYPEVLARAATGEIIGYASISYTHPLFLEKVRAWFDTVCPILAKYTVSRGGPIAFTQIDNEMVGIHEWFGSLDYHPATMGFGKTAGKYATFLHTRYPSLKTLNQAYETSYTHFSEVDPVLPAAVSPAARIRRQKDYFDCYLSSISDYAQFLVRLMREHGIDTPIVHNSGTFGMDAYFLETAQRLGKDFLLGSDHYYNLDQNWPQNNPTPQYAARCFTSLEMLRLLGYPPSVFEIPGGSASHWPPVTPGDALAAYFTNLAFGMKGSNYYIFTGGPNPPGVGQNTDLYDYGASIGAHGEIRPLYEAQKTFGTWIQSHLGWLTADRRSDFRLGMDFEYSRSGQYWRERGPYLFSNPDADHFLRKGVLTSALCAHLSPEFVNLDSDAWVSDTRTPLVIISSVSMGIEKQRRLVRFLQNGGRLVITPVVPTLDDALNPCTILVDFLGGVKQVANAAGLSRPRIQEVINVLSTTYPFAQLPQNARIAGVDEFSGQPIAAVIDVPGAVATSCGGQAFLLGISWTHAMREHERMLTSVLSGLGLERCLACSDPNLWLTLYVQDGQATLFALNLFTAPIEVEIQYRPGPGLPLQSAGRVRVEPISVKILTLPGS